MEEKERYEIHMYDDCCVDLYDNGVLDKAITDQWELEKLLNQQNARIKELEEALKKANTNNYLIDYYLVEKENQQLKQEVNDWKQRFNSSDKWCKTLLQNSVTVSELKNKKIEQLEQSQKQLAISELEKVKINVFKIDKIEIKTLENGYSIIYCARPEVTTIINNQIKELGGEEND